VCVFLLLLIHSSQLLLATLQRTASTASVSFPDRNQQNRATEASDSAPSASSSQSPTDPVRGATSLPSRSSPTGYNTATGSPQRLFLPREKSPGLTSVVLATGTDGRTSWTSYVLSFSRYVLAQHYSGRSHYPSPSLAAHHRPLFLDPLQIHPRKAAHPHLHPASRRGRLHPLPGSRRHVLPGPGCSRPHHHQPPQQRPHLCTGNGHLGRPRPLTLGIKINPWLDRLHHRCSLSRKTVLLRLAHRPYTP